MYNGTITFGRQTMTNFVYENEEFNQQIKDNIFTYSLLFTSPSDYLRQIFMTCGGGYEYDPSTGEIENFDGGREYETEMKYPEVSEYVPETMIRDAKLKFVAANIDTVIKEFDEVAELDRYSPVEMYIRNWTTSTLFFKMSKMVLKQPETLKDMTDKTLAAFSMFCRWVVERSQRSGMVYKPEGSDVFKGHTSYNIPSGFGEFVTTASLAYKALENEYNERHNIKYNKDALELVLEALYNVGNDKGES